MRIMSGEGGLRKLLSGMRPELNPGRYVFATAAGAVPDGLRGRRWSDSRGRRTRQGSRTTTWQAGSPCGCAPRSTRWD
ncbi:hypothetical protein B1H18_12440 [Streptomyces tsukubensis]|uniref:DUF2241 domain-containing protein n=1 Tax=Streptomyces tsukubensis TaxID=83656 RepID=A0A1V4AB70_9ACTN|nr:hypothetical protein B1H18_12440 [Streptomyces tsukubensis]